MQGMWLALCLNRFSRESTIYSILQPAFWRFSMDELFTIDFPDTLAYVLEATGHSKVCACRGQSRSGIIVACSKHGLEC